MSRGLGMAAASFRVPVSALTPVPACVSGRSRAMIRMGVCEGREGLGGWTDGNSPPVAAKVRGKEVTMLLGCMENQTTLGPSSAKSMIRRGLGQGAGEGGERES